MSPVGPPTHLRTAPAQVLPAQPTPLVGRESELRTLQNRLLDEDVRLLTLTGPGGIGKTRLAIALAERVADAFAHGVAFVDLARIARADLVPDAVAEALEVQDSGGESLPMRIRTALVDRELLLVLDNYEHVLDAAPWTAELLAACRRLKILATSRAGLRVRWEHAFSVPPLPVPEAGQASTPAGLAAVPSVALFVARARAIRPDALGGPPVGGTPSDQQTTPTAPSAPRVGAAPALTAVAEICRRLEGLPLAIELAAAWSDILPPSALLSRLDDRLGLLTRGAPDAPARHRALRAALDWSYELLSKEEQAFFRRLGVFVGGFTAEACASVAGDPEHALARLGSLVEKSLVQSAAAVAGEPRLRLLETIREYALARLTAAGEGGAAREAHARVYLTLAEAAEPRLTGAEQAIWLERIEAEHGNLRAALDWWLAAGAAGPGDQGPEAGVGSPTLGPRRPTSAEPGLRLAGALWRFWSIRGHLGEGRAMLDRVLAMPGSGQPAPTGSASAAAERAKALVGAAVLARQQGDFPTARALHEESLAVLGPAGGDERILADALFEQGVTFFYQGDLAAARPLYDRALALYRGLDDRRGEGHVRFRLANLHHLSREYDTAVRVHEQGLALLREVGDRRAIADSLFNLGYIALERGDLAGADAHLGASLELMVELGDRRGLAWVLEGFAGIAVARREAERALRLGGAADALREAIGVPMAPAGRQRLEASFAPARRALGEPAATAAWTAGRAMPMQEAIALASGTGPIGDAAAAPAADPLTPREREVAALIARGLTNRGIAEALVISEATAAVHVKRILAKLGFSSRAQVAAWAARRPRSEEYPP